MAGNTRAIVKDVDAKPAPQYFNPSADAYEYLCGRNGASRVELYDANGNPLLAQDNPGHVLIHGHDDGSTARIIRTTSDGRIDMKAFGITSIVVGAKTVTTMAAELYAGASRLANRWKMKVYNCGQDVVYLGPSGVTVSNGYPLLPGQDITFFFDPGADVAIYGIAESNVNVRVLEAS